MASRYLSDRQLRGLNRAGDALIPGGGEFPSFSKSGVAKGVDRMVGFMTPSDRDGLLGLLSLFAFLPRFAIRLLVWFVDRHRFFPGPIAAVMRMISLGVKGAVYTLYYGAPTIHPLIHWNAVVRRQL